MRLFVPLLLVAWACDSEKAVIDPSTLDPDTVVLAATSGGGFLMSGQEEFFVGGRHGRFGLWIYGDRRAIVLREDTLQTLGYRVYREGRVDEPAFRSLLDQASNLGLTGTHRYSACNATDGGSQGFAVALPGVSLVASSYLGFHLYDNCEVEAGAMSSEGKPPADLIAFAKELFAVAVADPVVLEPDHIVLAGHVVEGDAPPAHGCDPAATVEWAVDGVELPEDDPFYLWTLPLDGTPARDARAFVRAHLQDHDDASYWSACVQRCWKTCTQLADGYNQCSKECGDLYRVYYDDVPEGEEEWPF
jgi:hypothetical protein